MGLDEPIPADSAAQPVRVRPSERLSSCPGAYDLPFGKSRTFKMGGSRFADCSSADGRSRLRIVIQNGERADLPAGAVRLRNSHVQNIDWNQYQVKGWGNCVLNQDTNGNITADGVQHQGRLQRHRFLAYDWLVSPPCPDSRSRPAARATIRMKPSIDSNLAISKDFRVYDG
jgi:hypothetical protein